MLAAWNAFPWPSCPDANRPSTARSACIPRARGLFGTDVAPRNGCATPATTGHRGPVEQGAIVFTDLGTGAILDVLADGRRGTTVTSWLAARCRRWRRRVELVAVGLSAETRAAVRKALAKDGLIVDQWHVIRLIKEMVTKVRGRRVCGSYPPA